MGMGFGNHLVARYIKHGATGKAQHHGEEGGRGWTQTETQQNAYHFEQGDEDGNEEEREAGGLSADTTDKEESEYEWRD